MLDLTDVDNLKKALEITKLFCIDVESSLSYCLEKNSTLSSWKPININLVLRFTAFNIDTGSSFK